MWSVEWWTGVVVVGVGVHLLAAYLKPRLDRVGGWLSRSWAARNEKRTRARLARIDLLKRDDGARLAASFGEIRYRVRSVQFLLLSVLFIGIGTLVGQGSMVVVGGWVFRGCGIGALLTMLLALDDHSEAMQISRELSMALSEKEESSSGPSN